MKIILILLSNLLISLILFSGFGIGNVSFDIAQWSGISKTLFSFFFMVNWLVGVIYSVVLIFTKDFKIKSGT